MKKNLLIFVLFIGSGLNAQVLLTEDGSTLLPGNVGTELTGIVPGQGGWFTKNSVSSTGTNADFQIVDVDLGTIYGNVIKITGYSGAAAATPPSNSRFMSKNIASSWTSRDFGNEIAEVEYAFYTGPATTSSNTMRVVLYDSEPTSTAPKMLAGFMITMNPLSIRALAWYDPTVDGGTGTITNYSIPLGSDGGSPPVFSQITLNTDTWYNIGFSYNISTGELKFKGAGITRNSIQGASIGTNVDNVQIIGSTGGTVAIPNTASSTGTFDNLIIRATATDTLLAVKETTDSNTNFSVFPNPATNLIIVSSKNNAAITAVTMTDINGRIIKNQSFDTLATIEMNVSDIASGMYMMTIVSNEGNVTKKIVKN